MLTALLAEVQVGNEKTYNPLIPHVGEIILGLIAFGVLVFVLLKAAFPAIEKTYAARQDAIEGGIKRAEDAQTEAQRTLEQYRQQLAEARQEAARIVERSREQGQQIVTELQSEAQERARTITENATREIEADRQRAFAELRGDIGRLAVDLAGRIVSDALQDSGRRQQVVDSFLDELENPQQSTVS